MSDDNTINEIYLKDLKKYVEEFAVIERQFVKISEDRRVKTRTIKSLVSFLKGAYGESAVMELVHKAGLAKAMDGFLTIDDIATAGRSTVVRRRKGTKVVEPVDPSAILPKGARVKVLAGKYENWSGTVATSQARQGRNGLDVTYFLLLVGPKGIRKRTSVKHGTLNKSWKKLD